MVEQQPIIERKSSGRARSNDRAKAGTSARDRRALQQLALNVHVKHSDLT